MNEQLLHRVEYVVEVGVGLPGNWIRPEFGYRSEPCESYGSAAIQAADFMVRGFDQTRIVKRTIVEEVVDGPDA